MNRIGLPSLIFLVFLTLKLTNYITWSWLWVTSPLWISFGIWFILLSFILVLEALK